MNSIVEQACNSVNGHSAPDAFNLIESQEQRIKELEAERDGWREELELIRAVLDGFQPCMAKSDGLRAVHKLLAAAPKKGEKS